LPASSLTPRPQPKPEQPQSPRNPAAPRQLRPPQRDKPCHLPHSEPHHQTSQTASIL
jgi:hypothetical protein